MNDLVHFQPGSASVGPSLQPTDEIGQVIHDQLLWIKKLNRALYFDSSDFPNYLELSPDQTNRFRSMLRHAFSENPQLTEIVELQRNLKEIAQRLFSESRASSEIDAKDYDTCMELFVELNAKMRKFQLDIMSELLAIDPLTGCYTRHQLERRLVAELERSRRNHTPLSVCMIDFDHFKAINDTHGHAAGDTVLREMMERIIGKLRKYDTVFRYGGEEFLLSLPDTSIDDAMQIVQRLCEIVAATPVVLSNQYTLFVTASFGLAELTGAVSLYAGIEMADQALYNAKHAGRNQVQQYNPEWTN
jgi:diguanylate cyclase (GGDEF)-like protein